MNGKNAFIQLVISVASNCLTTKSENGCKLESADQQPAVQKTVLLFFVKEGERLKKILKICKDSAWLIAFALSLYQTENQRCDCSEGNNSEHHRGTKFAMEDQNGKGTEKKSNGNYGMHGLRGHTSRRTAKPASKKSGHQSRKDKPVSQRISEPRNKTKKRKSKRKARK